jgi:hypothetical protein
MTLRLIILLTTFLSFNAQAQMLFKASVNAPSITIGSTVSYSVTLENVDSRSFKPPSFEGFNIVSGPSTSMSSTTINGVTSSEFKYVYVLQPKEVGEYVIPAATAMYENKRIKSNLVKVVVKKGQGGAKNQNDLAKNMEGQMFVRAVPSTDTAYIGQQVILNYNIYYTTSVKRYDQITEPKYDGFFSKQLRSVGRNNRIEEINGVKYNVTTVRKVALYPQQTGKLDIEESKFKLGVSSSNNNSRRVFFERYNYFYFNTEALTINVLPLPDNAPASFSGAVGDYTAQSNVTPSNLTTDDALTILLEIYGNGDVKQNLPPKVIFDENLEVYNTSVIEKKTIPREGYLQSFMKVEYTVLPKVAKRYLIQPQFSFFNPDSARYVTIRTGVDNVMVRQGKGKKTEKAVVSESEAMSSALKPIMTSTSLSTIKTSAWIQQPIGKALLLFPIFAMGAILLYRQNEIKKGNIDPNLIRKQKAGSVAKQRLQTAEKFMKAGDNKSFYDEIAASIFGYIANKLDIPFSELSKDNISSKLQAENVAAATIEKLSSLLSKCEMARFAGGAGAENMQTVYNDAQHIIESLEQGGNI